MPYYLINRGETHQLIFHLVDKSTKGKPNQFGFYTDKELLTTLDCYHLAIAFIEGKSPCINDLPIFKQFFVIPKSTQSEAWEITQLRNQVGLELLKEAARQDVPSAADRAKIAEANLDDMQMSIIKELIKINLGLFYRYIPISEAMNNKIDEITLTQWLLQQHNDELILLHANNSKIEDKTSQLEKGSLSLLKSQQRKLKDQTMSVQMEDILSSKQLLEEKKQNLTKELFLLADVAKQASTFAEKTKMFSQFKLKKTFDLKLDPIAEYKPALRR